HAPARRRRAPPARLRVRARGRGPPPRPAPPGGGGGHAAGTCGHAVRPPHDQQPAAPRDAPLDAARRPRPVDAAVARRRRVGPMTAPGAPPPPQPPVMVVPGAGWVDVASRAIVQVGFPVVVAGVLLWFVLGKFQTNMDTITSRMEKNADAVNAFVAQLKTQTTELETQTHQLGQQGQLIAEIADNAAKLVEIRQEELKLLQRRKPGHDEHEEPQP